MSIRPTLYRFARGGRGATTVEFALIALLLFGLICAVLELAMILFAQNSLENAARFASRYGITDQSVPSGSTREAEILAVAKGQLPRLIDPTKVHLALLTYEGFGKINQPEPYDDKNDNKQYDPGESFTDVNGNGVWDKDQGAVGPGGASQIVLYNLTYDWGSLFGITRLLGLTPLELSARVVVQNEP